MSFGNAQQIFFPQPFHLPLQGEHLEDRRLLSVSPTGGSDADHPFPEDPLNQAPVVDIGASEATELWQAVSQDELLSAANENDPFGTSAGADEPLPAVPIDDSVDPFTDCPGLDSEFCLPGDANQDGSVDFSDFLLLNENFGREDATWGDGDFDHDGMVTFNDLLILSASLGTV